MLSVLKMLSYFCFIHFFTFTLPSKSTFCNFSFENFRHLDKVKEKEE
jgi:hypothetical protein